MQASQRRFLDDVFFPTLLEHDVRRVLHGGDYGDRRKYINIATAHFIEEAYRGPLRARGIREDVIIGNHDCFLRDSTAVNSVQALYHLDPSVHVYTQPTEVDIDGCGVLLLPWICGNNRDRTMKALVDTSCTVVLGHLEIAGFQMYRGVPHQDGLSRDLFERFALVMSGHFHHRSAQSPVQYLGAAWPMVWSDYNDPRGFHLFDTDTKALTFVPNPYSVFARLVYDDAEQPESYATDLVESILAPASSYRNAYVKVVVKSRTRPYGLDLVLDALAKVDVADLIVVDDVATVQSDGDMEVSVDVDTMALMRDYVENHAGINPAVDKKELVHYITSIYREAVNLSVMRST